MNKALPRFLSTDRLVILTVALGLTLLSWLVVIVGPAAPWSGVIDLASFVLFIAVWAVGMVAMMLPSLVPMVFLIVSASRQTSGVEGTSSTSKRMLQPLQFVLGYLGIWTFVGFAAYLGLAFLFRYYLPFSSLGQFVGLAAGIAVFLAGVYQLSPLKQKALEECRSPMNFVMTKWRTGSVGGLIMGTDYGFYCTKCCWAFMAVLVVVGAMNLLWMVLFAGIIFVEKIAPRGILISRGLGVLLMIGGVVLAAVP